jgi:molybdate transport system substrate-binding protein
MLRLIALLLTLAPAPLWAQNVTVFAAASLKNALDQAAQDWSAKTGGQVTLSFAGSAALARQIQAGAPADLFISANQGWMDHLAALGLINTDSRVALLSNRLVLIAPADAAPLPTLGPDTDLAARLGPDNIALALTEAVPAGIYAKAALTHLGLWPQIAGKIAQTDNVRAALALVALGEAPLGVTYASDAAVQPKVRVLAEFPADSHPKIVYPAALTSDNSQAADFLSFLQSPRGQAIFAQAGFLPPEAE